MEEKNKQLEKEPYIAPNIEVAEIEAEQNIFANSGTSQPRGMDAPGSDW